MAEDRAEAWRRERLAELAEQLRRRRAELDEQLALLHAGKMRTHESRVDTTQAPIAWLEKYVAALKSTIARIESQMAEIDAMPAMLRFFAGNLESDYMRKTLGRGEETGAES